MLGRKGMMDKNFYKSEFIDDWDKRMGWWNLQRKEEWLFRGQICSKWTFQISLERAIISFGMATKRIPNKSDADYENKLAVLHREILGAGLENYNVSNL